MQTAIGAFHGFIVCMAISVGDWCPEGVVQLPLLWDFESWLCSLHTVGRWCALCVCVCARACVCMCVCICAWCIRGMCVHTCVYVWERERDCSLHLDVNVSMQEAPFSPTACPTSTQTTSTTSALLGESWGWPSTTSSFWMYTSQGPFISTY